MKFTEKDFVDKVKKLEKFIDELSDDACSIATDSLKKDGKSDYNKHTMRTFYISNLTKDFPGTTYEDVSKFADRIIESTYRKCPEIF